MNFWTMPWTNNPTIVSEETLEDTTIVPEVINEDGNCDKCGKNADYDGLHCYDCVEELEAAFRADQQVKEQKVFIPPRKPYVPVYKYSNGTAYETMPCGRKKSFSTW